MKNLWYRQVMCYWQYEEAKALGGVPGAVAEAHALHLPFDGVSPPDGALGQGGGLAVLFIQKIEHKRLTAPDMRSSERG